MSDIKLVATDMDGTFLKEDGSFDKKRLEKLLSKFKQAGIVFTVASGRPMLALDEIFEAFKQEIAFVAENGSFVSYQGEVLFEAQMASKDYLKIASLLEPLADMQGYLLSGREGAYVPETASDDYVAFIKHYYRNVQKVADLADVTDDIFKVTVNFSQETVHEREAWLNTVLDGAATAMTTGFQSLDIILSDVDKSTGLKGMCQTLGIQPSQVIAFGDNMNDYQMLEFAGKAIATANARQAVKDISDELIGHCNDEAVMAYMEGLVD